MADDPDRAEILEIAARKFIGDHDPAWAIVVMLGQIVDRLERIENAVSMIDSELEMRRVMD